MEDKEGLKLPEPDMLDIYFPISLVTKDGVEILVSSVWLN